MLDNLWKRNILVLGSDGMLGYDVLNFLEDESRHRKSMLNKVVGLTGKQCREIGIHDPDRLRRYLGGCIRFDYVVNCVAHTDTKGIETSDMEAEKSYLANVTIPKTVAEVCRDMGIRLIHISTDYVYSEWSKLQIFDSQSPTTPKNRYGCHKLLGEMFIRNTLDQTMYAILRTSSLYGMHGSKSFVHRVLRDYYAVAKHNSLPVSSDKRSVPHDLNLEMVSDSYSVPTSTNVVKHSIMHIIKTGNFGVFCACGGLEKSPGLGHGSGVTPLVFADAIVTTFGEMYKNDRGVDPFNLDAPYLEPVNMPDDDFHPRYSTMKTDIDHGCLSYLYHWKDELNSFIRENYDKLSKYIETYE